jgi:hypothetical protein
MSISSSAPGLAGEACQQLRCAQIERSAVVQGGQRVAGGDLRDTLLAAMALGAGHGHRKQHDRHHAFHQRDHNHHARKLARLTKASGATTDPALAR